MSGSAIGYRSISRGCIDAVAVEALKELRDEAVYVMLGVVLLIEVLDPSVAET